MELNALVQKRNEAIVSARRILETAQKENRGMTEHESGLYNKIYDEAQDLNTQIKQQEQQRKLDKMEVLEKNKIEKKIKSDNTDEVRKRAFEKHLRQGNMASYSPEESRALQADLDANGGYLVAPEMMANEIIKFVDDEVFIRQVANVLTLPMGETLVAPSLDNDPADPDWTSEISTGSEDSTMSFGKRSLTPHPLAKRLKVSEKLMRVSSFDVMGFVSQRLAYKLAIAQEKGFLTGDGANEPLGVFTASGQGISTSRDYSTGNTTTEIRFDGLKGAKHNVKSQYWRQGQWLLHRDAVSQISKLKDGNGQYLWQPSNQVGEPDLLLGSPVMMSEYAPNTFTTGQYVGLYGDFNAGYWIADALGFRIQVLRELYAETNQVGLIIRAETDGMPVLEEAFSRLTLA